MLTPTQQKSQAVRLAQAVPCLAEAYAQALGRWVGDPVTAAGGAAHHHGVLPQP